MIINDNVNKNNENMKWIYNEKNNNDIMIEMIMKWKNNEILIMNSNIKLNVIWWKYNDKIMKINDIEI